MIDKNWIAPGDGLNRFTMSAPTSPSWLEVEALTLNLDEL
jgi:hypothetical protein